MTAITSIYIPRIETVFNAEFIADIFDRNGIAKVSRVYIEPYKSLIKNGLNNYNRAYIAIKTWYDTEAAFNFIDRLRNPTREARLIYSDDNWWPVDINNNTTKLASNKRVLTVFEDNQFEFDNLSTTAVASDELNEFIQIDAEKTKLLRNIIAKFKIPSGESETSLYRTQALHKREHLLQDMDEAANALDGYMREMDIEREKWYSEQYIYDYLDM